MEWHDLSPEDTPDHDAAQGIVESEESSQTADDEGPGLAMFTEPPSPRRFYANPAGS